MQKINKRKTNHVYLEYFAMAQAYLKDGKPFLISI
jgi:hypothetical protein